MNNYLVKRGAVWYFRRRVPPDVLRFFRQSFVVASLHTAKLAEARRLVGKRLYDLEKIITAIRLNMLTEAQIYTMIEKYKGDILNKYQTPRDEGSSAIDAVLSGNFPLINMLDSVTLASKIYGSDRSSSDIAAVVSRYERNITYLKNQLSMNQLDDDSRRNAYSLLLKNNFESVLPPKNYLNPNEDEYFHDPPKEFNRVARAAMRADIEIYETEIQRILGEDTEYDRNRRKELAKPNITFAELCEQYHDAKRTAVKATALVKIGQHNSNLLRIIGDTKIRDLTEPDLLRVGEIVKKWPTDATKRPELANVPVADIITRRDLGPPLAAQTVKGRLTHLSTLFKFAATKGWVDRTPCPRWKFREELTINDDGELVGLTGYKPWSLAEVRALLTTPYFADGAVQLKKPENYWIPLLALFTGCRVNELCQLYCDDVLSADGVLVFRIQNNASRHQSVKVDKPRNVPVHKTLIDLGFLNYRDFAASQGERLFSRLKYNPKLPSYSIEFSKRFSKYTGRSMSWDKPDESRKFHGLRSTFIKTLRDGGLALEQIGYLVGHAPQRKVTAGYAGTPPAALLSEYLQRLDYGIDFVGILGVWKAPK